MTSSELRQSFLDFFAARGHRIVPSAPVIPQGDPTLLFTNAGMNQFKDVFLGTGTREYSRAADTQKCIRVSGKHNDLEEVGHDTYHHTLFEMLGNWSFADYGKKEAISWAWELLTDVWKLPKDRLYVTVFRTDDEAHKLWSSVTDINPSHIMKFDEKDNFWEMGETGPCGPCSEIHIDLTDDKSGGPLVNTGSPLAIELWNLVFIQYNRIPGGKLEPLPNLFVDTGMGFERVCAVMQGKKSNYDTDVFAPLLNKIGELCGTPYNKFPHDGIEQISMRVMADHIRTLTFAIADGAIPSNEDRGYVLRRILRRASRYARNIGLTVPSLYKLVPTLVAQLGDVFPEIVTKQPFIERVIKAEEENFNVTLDRGLEFFTEIATRSSESESPIITGEEAFLLYDSLGFPLDLTVLMAKEWEMTVDVAGFEKLMKKQKERSRISSGKAKTKEGMLVTVGDESWGQDKFVGYEREESVTQISSVQSLFSQSSDGTSQAFGVTLIETPFYLESGGQVSDTGWLEVYDPVSGILESTPRWRLRVTGMRKTTGSRLHEVPLTELQDLYRFVLNLYSLENAGATNSNELLSKYLVGKRVVARYDAERRAHIIRNHTATHLVHEALRRIVGTHLHQQGSLVAPERMRFDFNHFEKIPDEQLRDIEQLVNSKIREGIPVFTEEMKIDQAKMIPNVKMFFGDKYGDDVRVVIADPNYSVEFCGGTHVQNTADIGYFKLVAEAGIASGMRRIEAVTGFEADKILQDRYREIERLSHKLNVPDRDLYRKVEELLEDKKQLEKELGKFKLQAASSQLDTLIAASPLVNNIRVVASRMDGISGEELKNIAEAFRGKLGSGVGVIASVVDDKVQLMCVVTDDLSKKLSAGKIVGEISKMIGGSGGGRPTMATGGGKDVSKLEEALAAVAQIVSRA